MLYIILMSISCLILIFWFLLMTLLAVYFIFILKKWSKSHSVVSDSLRPHRLYGLCSSPGQILEWVSHFLLKGIFPTQGLNPDLLHYRQILYQLSHQGSSRILEWVAYPFSSGSSQSRNRTGVSCIADRFFTSWAIREAHVFILDYGNGIRQKAISTNFLIRAQNG